MKPTLGLPYSKSGLLNELYNSLEHYKGQLKGFCVNPQSKYWYKFTYINALVKVDLYAKLIVYIETLEGVELERYLRDLRYAQIEKSLIRLNQLRIKEKVANNEGD